MKDLNKLSEENIDLPETNGFSVPEGYFEELNESIQEKLTKKEAKVINLSSYKKFYLVAASIAAVLLLIFGLNFNDTEKPSWDDLANADIEAYFEINELGLTTYEIAEVLPVDELEINEILDDEFEEEDIIDYLNENIDDIEDLNLEDYE